MRIFKRSLAWMLALCMVLSISGPVLAADEPNGTWGDNISWYIEDGVLRLSGQGEVKYIYSGTQYPWYAYRDQFTEIVVEDGITAIPSYAFEYLEGVTSITLPETLISLTLNAFNDCYSLNHLLLPASLKIIEGTSNTGHPAFIRCLSLTDVYYMGTEEEWQSLPNAEYVVSSNSDMTLHFLQLRGCLATCTEEGTEPHYRFDEISVYDGIYDLNKQPITEPETIPALGHRVLLQSGETLDPLVFENDEDNPFNLDGEYYNSTNFNEHHSSSEVRIKAVYPCTLKLTYGVSCEEFYDYFYILHNGVELDRISGEVNGKEMTVPMKVGDVVAIGYSKDMSNSEGEDCGWFTPAYDKVTLTEAWEVPAESLAPDCLHPVVCDYCSEVVYGALGHDFDASGICIRCGYREIPSSAVTLDLANGSIVITQADGITTFKQGENEIRTTAGAGIIRQSNNTTPTANTITVENGTVDLTVSGVYIVSTSGAPIDVKADAKVNLHLQGMYNHLEAGAYHAGVEVAEGAALTINGSGALTTTGGAQGAGIGGGQNQNSGTIVINGGSITATGGTTAAAIGGGSKGSGTIIINGGVVNATQAQSSPGAAIGSGDGGGGSTISITGGTITAISGLSGVAIGGGITGSTISISGGTVTATGGGNTGAGIGSNSRNAGGSVYISNANVTASGYYHAIGGRGKGNDYGLDSVVIEDSATVNLSHRSSEGADVRERIIIDTPAADMTAPAGENVTLSIEAHGASGLTYQWRVSPNGSTYNTLAGETADTLSVTVSADNDGYTYSCLMINGWGNKLTSEAKVYMEKPADRGMEYTINRMGMYDIDTHEEYKSIPKDRFFVEIEVTNDCSAQVDAMMIVQYSPEGQMLDLDYHYSRTLIGETAIFGAMIDNRTGEIGCIKAFVVPTVGSMIPLAESMEIGEMEEPVEDYTMAVMVAGNTATIVVEGEMPADSGVKVMLWKDGKYSNVGYATWIGVADGVHTYEFINNMTADYEFLFQLVVGGEVYATQTIVVPC